mgnify:CR=1 FL=1
MWKRNCPICNKELTYTQKHNWVSANVNVTRCSHCRVINRKGNNVECLWCKKPIYRRPSSLREDKHYFCSLKCQKCFSSKYQSGKNSKVWKGGKEKSRLRYLEWSNKRRLENKKRALDILGNKCIKCGYDKCIDVFDFHHTDPNEKDAEICKLLSKKWDEKIEKEIKKCQLLCSNCHREIHWEERQKL